MGSELADVAVIGQAVMGQNLILRMDECGFKVLAFNRTTSKVHDFLANEAKGTNVIGANSLEDMVSKLKLPRKVILLVRAGQAVDDFINQLTYLLHKGDIIIDAGNSSYKDTVERYKRVTSQGLLFIGTGVCGGEEAARYGPSFTPGGSREAWPLVKKLFQTICATADGEPCCEWVGPDGAGHFVKMVHNGIEYGDMQIICEAYHLMKESLNMSHDEMADVFDEWNKGELNSYLLRITKDILRYKDQDGEPILEKIRDSAGQKGTGKWTAIASLDFGVPVTLIGEAVFARFLSAMKEEREDASDLISGPNKTKYEGSREEFLEDLRKAIYASKVALYSQGFMLMKRTSQEMKWNLNLASVAVMWRGGCVIESVFLGEVKRAYLRKHSLRNLLLDDFFRLQIQRCQHSWRKVIGVATQLGVPVPVCSGALAFFDGYRRNKLPANLIQAQRDFFGAHSYELMDSPGTFVHTDWTGTGGKLTATTYNA